MQRNAMHWASEYKAAQCKAPNSANVSTDLPVRVLPSVMHLDGCHCSGSGAAQLVAPGGVKESHETECLLRISSMGLDVMDPASKSW